MRRLAVLILAAFAALPVAAQQRRLQEVASAPTLSEADSCVLAGAAVQLVAGPPAEIYCCVDDSTGDAAKGWYVDCTPAGLDETATPTWTGTHTFDADVRLSTVYGAAYLPAYADSGAGTTGDPWDITSTGWNQIKGGKIHAPAGVYEIAHGAQLDFADGTELLCDVGAVLRNPSTTRTVATPMFLVPSAADRVVIDGCTFDSGITVPETDMCQTGSDTHTDGPQYIEIGVAGQTGAPEVILTKNEFRAHRRNASAEYARGHMIRFQVGSRGARIERNRFGLCDRCIVFRAGHATVTNTHRGLRVDGNIFDGGNYANVPCDKSGPLLDARQNGGLAQTFEMRDVSFSNNTLLNIDGTFEVALDIYGLVFADNVGVGDYLDEFLQLEAGGGDAYAGKLLGATITGNMCIDENYGLQAAVGCDYHLGAAEWVTVANNVHRSSPATPWVEIADGAKHITIENNVFDSHFLHGFGPNIAEGIELRGTVSDITIRNNTFGEVSYAVRVYGATTRLHVEGNTHESATVGQLLALVDFNGGSCTDCSVVANRTAGVDYASDWTDDRTQFARYEGNQIAADGSDPWELYGPLRIRNAAGGTWTLDPGALAGALTWTSPGVGTAGQSYVSRSTGAPEWGKAGYVVDRFGVLDRPDANGATSGSWQDLGSAWDVEVSTFAKSNQATGDSGIHTQDWTFNAGTSTNYVVDARWGMQGTAGTSNCASPGNATGRILYCTSGPSCTPATEAATCSGSVCGDVRTLADIGSADPANVVLRAEFTANGSTGFGRCFMRVYDLRLEGGDGTSVPPAATAHPLLPGTAATTYGIAIWADGSQDAYDTGDEACAAVGLTCKDAWTAGADSACGTDQSATFVALCHE